MTHDGGQRDPHWIKDHFDLDPEPDSVPTLQLTADQQAVTVSALWDLLVETERYLRSTSPGSGGHDECCPTARARSAALAEQHALLEQRREHILQVLDQLDPDGEHRTGRTT